MKFGTDEVKNIVEAQDEFAKFEKGVLNKVTIISNEIIPRKAEFDNKIVDRYDIRVLIDNKEKTWSVSKKVLKTINEYYDKTKDFLVIRQENSYSVVPNLK